MERQTCFQTSQTIEMSEGSAIYEHPFDGWLESSMDFSCSRQDPHDRARNMRSSEVIWLFDSKDWPEYLREGGIEVVADFRNLGIARSDLEESFVESFIITGVDGEHYLLVPLHEVRSQALHTAEVVYDEDFAISNREVRRVGVGVHDSVNKDHVEKHARECSSDSIALGL